MVSPDSTAFTIDSLASAARRADLKPLLQVAKTVAVTWALIEVVGLLVVIAVTVYIVKRIERSW